MKQRQHPEQGEGELYLGNTLEGEAYKSSWRTTRLGRVPYDSKGQIVNATFGNYRPWFILASEVEGAIAAEERDPKPWSAEKIKVYQQMLDERS